MEGSNSEGRVGANGKVIETSWSEDACEGSTRDWLVPYRHRDDAKATAAFADRFGNSEISDRDGPRVVLCVSVDNEPDPVAPTHPSLCVCLGLAQLITPSALKFSSLRKMRRLETNRVKKG